MSWQRTSKKLRCPICKKDSWCFVSSDGVSALCMRVQSNRPHTFHDLTVGWIHGDGTKVMVPIPDKMTRAEYIPENKLQFIIETYRSNTKPEVIEAHAKELGVKASALIEMRVGYSARNKAFAWPMCDGRGRVCGIRFRTSAGEKWSLTGSKNGLFYPWCSPEKELWICEGGTDTAALRSINLFAIGRPSCSGGMVEIKAMVDMLGIRRAYIIADNDKPGLDGAESLTRNLQIPCLVMTLPTKDVREYLRKGGNQNTLLSMTHNMKWRNPK